LLAQATGPRDAAPAQQVQAQTQAQNWTGALVDATCKQSTPDQKCAVSSGTTAFGLVTGGKLLKFDDAGNSMASKEMQKTGAKSGDPSATVAGALDGDTIKVESIQIR
jgi:hypothetical protein